MKYAVAASLLLGAHAPATALDFGKPVTVVEAQAGVFHHLESSGRSSLAVSKDTVGIVWEDNSIGTPQVYVAFKRKDASRFSKPIQVSDSGPAYEPAITVIDDNFVIAWEANDQLWLRAVTASRRGPVTLLSKARARQVTFATTPQQRAVAAWSEKDTQSYHIRVATVLLEGATVKVRDNRAVDNSTDRKEQLYPAVAVTQKGMVVGWEDRRKGVTRIVTAFAPAGEGFAPYQPLNDFRYSPSRGFGRGTGAMRVALSSDQRGRVIAVWLDKRDFEQGYDVYAAYSDDGGRQFGKDEKVQDPLGDNTPQWHPAIAISRNGAVVAAWDDTRDDQPDIWFSIRNKNQWSEDDVWPESNGDGAQTQPLLFFEDDTLHAAWLDRQKKTGAIRYIAASRSK